MSGTSPDPATAPGHRPVIGVLARVAGVILAVIAVLIVVTAKPSHKNQYAVRAIFDDAAFAVQGEEVRIAGATVGSIKSLEVAPERKAAVTLLVTNLRFAPFHANATCSIRPQSLIGEKYVDCDPGSASAPVLARIGSGPGSGSYYLPVTRTHSPVDSDIVQSIYREPTRQRFALIINELGTGLAARGSDLNEVIHRADPALGYTDQVLKILAAQNRQLAQLSADSDTVLGPLAQVRRQIQGFITGANTTSAASATRAAAITNSVRLFPSFLRQLRPLVVQLGNLAGQGTPLMASLAQSAGALGRQFQNLAPFATAARPALITLGHYSQLAQPSLVGTLPLNRLLLRLGRQSLPGATLLDQLTASFDKTGGIEQLMSLLFYGTSAGNGFDSTGHYLRTEPLVGSCTTYDVTALDICNAHFHTAAAARAAGAAAIASTVVQRLTPTPASASPPTGGGSVSAKPSPLPALLHYLIGTGR